MDSDKVNVFKLVEGLRPVDGKALADFESAMADDAIPKIVRDVEKRRMLAAESRQRRLEMPADQKTDLK